MPLAPLRFNRTCAPSSSPCGDRSRRATSPPRRNRRRIPASCRSNRSPRSLRGRCRSSANTPTSDSSSMGVSNSAARKIRARFALRRCCSIRSPIVATSSSPRSTFSSRPSPAESSPTESTSISTTTPSASLTRRTTSRSTTKGRETNSCSGWRSATSPSSHRRRATSPPVSRAATTASRQLPSWARCG